MKRLLPLFLCFAFLVFSISQAKIYFHSDFELGETYLADAIDSGVKTIELVENHRLAEWPNDSGTGIIEGNLPEASETFFYHRRQGKVLKGVIGIRHAHPQWADVRTGGLSEWEGIEKGPTNAVQSNLLFGNYCAEFFPSTEAGRLFLRAEIPSEPKALFFRFYVAFSKEFLLAAELYQTLLRVATINDVLPELKVVRRIGNPWPDIHFESANETDTLQHEFPLSSAASLHLAPNRAYEIEFSFSRLDSSRHIYSLEFRVDHILRSRQQWKIGIEKLNFQVNTVFVGARNDSPGKIWMDEFICSDQLIGPVAPSQRIAYQNQALIYRMNRPFVSGESLASTQWMIHSRNVWLFPQFSSGEEFINPTALGICGIPIHGILDQNDIFSGFSSTGVQPGRSYWATCRIRNNFANWSDWSVPVFFRTEDSLKCFQQDESMPQIVKVYFSKIGKKRAIKKLPRGKWVDLHVDFSNPDSAGLKGISFVDLQFSSDSYGHQGNAWNRGGLFDPSSNYIISLSINDNNVYAKQNPMTDASTNLTHRRGLYIDGSKNLHKIDPVKRQAILRMRLLESFRLGPCIIRGFVATQSYRISPLFSDLIWVENENKPALQDRNLSIWLPLAGLVLLLGLGAWIYFLRVQHRKKMAILQIEKEEELKQPAILPLDPGMPHYTNIKKTVDYILENYSKPITMRDAAQAIGLSPKWLSEFFSEVTGKTVSQFLAEVRIWNAKKLLRESNENITEIAFKVGFSQASRFFELFKRLEKISPKEYQKFCRKS